MSISFFGLDIAVTGMNANQKALEVTGHNVSNLGTAGFSRQSATLVPAATRSYGNWKVEMGVDIQEVRQIRDIFQDNIVRTETNALGYWETRYNAVSDVQEIIAEPIKDGLQAAMNKFWDSWQELSKAPESLTVRSLVRQRADALITFANKMGTQLNKLQSDLNDEIRTRISEVNDITEDIADLNVKIMSSEAGNNSPNDWYDQRNLLVDKLSKLVKADVNVGQDGAMDVSVGGYFLVSKGEQLRLEAASNADYSAFYTPRLEGTDIDVNVGQGIIKGLLEGRGEVSGATGSLANGTPNTTAEITIAVDVSDSSAASLANIQANIANAVADIQTSGMDFSLRLVTYDGSGVLSSTGYDQDTATFLSDVAALTPTASSGQDFGAVVTEMESIAAGPDTNRYLLVFTGESPNGDGTVASDATISDWFDRLNAAGFETSVSTAAAYAASGDAGESGWNLLTQNTGGRTYDIGAADFGGMLLDMTQQVSASVNANIVDVPQGTNIISSIRRQINALINIMAREVNKLHQSGIDLQGNAGGSFFEAIDDTRPMEMGNLRVAVDDINEIVAGLTDANGDNQVALEIGDLRNLNLMTGKDRVLSIDTYYQNLILEVGNTGYDAESIMTNQRSLVEQADALRQSVMGVSLDEEMSNMIKFKYAYNAASKTINVVDEMIDTIVNRMFA